MIGNKKVVYCQVSGQVVDVDKKPDSLRITISLAEGKFVRVDRREGWHAIVLLVRQDGTNEREAFHYE